MKNNKLIQYFRWGLLAVFTILVTIAGYLHIVQGGGKSPSIHALCPFGGLESLYQVFTTGSFVSKIYSGTMILFVITLVLAIVFRRSFCGIICPFGFIQEFFAKIGQLIFKKKFTIPAQIDKPLRYLKYVVLVVTVVFAWQTAGLWMSPYDPWAAYNHLSEGLASVWGEMAIGLILLFVTIIGSFLYDRFFCKYLCPMGALYGIIGKISPYKVTRDKNVCVDCGKCNKVCPMNIDVQHSEEVKSAECINCNTCVLSCPKAGALDSKIAKKPIKPLVGILLVVGLFFGSIFIFQALGVYKLLPDRIKAGETIKISELKGYMTVKDAAEATKMELKEFYKLFKIPEDIPQETMMKELSKKIPNYDYDKIKEELGGKEEGHETTEGTKTETTKTEATKSDVKIDVSQIKGKMSIKEAAATAKVEVKEFYKLFKIPENIPDNTYLKDISKTVPEFDLDKAKAQFQ